MSRIRLAPSGHEIEAEPGDTVLAALERAGYALANNCRAGACGECKTKVLAGDYDQGMVLSMALSAADREDGYGLMCMATPLSDLLEIDYGTLDAKPRLFPPRTGVPHLVVDRIERTPRMLELRLRPLGDPMRYWPGQYVMLGDEPNGVPKRCYSLASAPRPDGELVLLVTRVVGGAASSWIHDQVGLGDQVLLDGAYGTFIGDPATDTPVVCLAAGSGLAPIMSLSDAALRRGFPHPVTLVVSSRSAEDDVAIGLMRWWEKVHPNFHLVVTHTRVNDGSEPDTHHQRIPDLLEPLFESLTNTSVFVAGSPEFVDDCVAKAKSLGATDDLIHTEGHNSQLTPTP
jgi:CDP-4-dehydro-6-deoxyglucose reductase